MNIFIKNIPDEFREDMILRLHELLNETIIADVDNEYIYSYDVDSSNPNDFDSCDMVFLRKTDREKQ